jgi:hypothetical protein
MPILKLNMNRKSRQKYWGQKNKQTFDLENEAVHFFVYKSLECGRFTLQVRRAQVRY